MSLAEFDLIWVLQAVVGIEVNITVGSAAPESNVAGRMKAKKPWVEVEERRVRPRQFPGAPGFTDSDSRTMKAIFNVSDSRSVCEQ